MFNIGDKVFYAGVWGEAPPRPCVIVGKGKKNGQVVYDNDLGHWGYAQQYTTRTETLDQALSRLNKGG